MFRPPSGHKNIYMYLPPQYHHMFLWTFRGFPPGCGDSVVDFWGWDAHEARLRCPDDVSGVTKTYNDEKQYSVRSLVAVHILNLQRDLVVVRFIHIELMTCATGEVDRVKVHIERGRCI